MGFRFSRRVKILPGISLNFSSGGVSLSTGVRGARMNFSSKGVYATTGIPGTGISYRQRIDGGSPRSHASGVSREQVLQSGNPANNAFAERLLEQGPQRFTASAEEVKRYRDDGRFALCDPQTGRKLSRRQLDAMIREAELDDKVKAAQSQVDKEWSDYQGVLNHWQPLPPIPTPEDFVKALSKQPFEPDFYPPEPPDWPTLQAKFTADLTAEFKQQWSFRFLPEVFARKRAVKELPARWPEEEAQVQRTYDAGCTKYDERLSENTQAWDRQEEERIARVQKLLAGDADETHSTALALIASLHFPFQTDCDVFLEELGAIYLHVDLPEIESTILATTKKVLKSGDIREVKRSSEDCNNDYLHLVVGQCIYLGVELFSCLPLTETVRIAAYTRRLRRLESDPIDTYVLDVPLQRAQMAEFAQNPTNAIAFMAKQGGRMQIKANGELASIDPPSWLSHEDLAQAKCMAGSVQAPSGEK